MKKADLIVIAIILLAAGGLALALMTSSSEGEYAVISSDGAELMRLPLNGEPCLHTIRTDTGYNIILVGGGSARVEDSDCPDRLCVHRGAIDKPNQTAVCLPHRVVLSIEGSSDIDSVSE